MGYRFEPVAKSHMTEDRRSPVRPLRNIGDSYRARLVIGYVLVAAVFSAAWLLVALRPLTQGGPAASRNAT